MCANVHVYVCVFEQSVPVLLLNFHRTTSNSSNLPKDSQYEIRNESGKRNAYECDSRLYMTFAERRQREYISQHDQKSRCLSHSLLLVDKFQKNLRKE